MNQFTNESFHILPPVFGLPTSLLKMVDHTVLAIKMMQEKAGVNRKEKRKIYKKELPKIPDIDNLKKELSDDDFNLLSNYCHPQARLQAFWATHENFSFANKFNIKSTMLAIDIPLLNAYRPDWRKLELDENQLSLSYPKWLDLYEKLKKTVKNRDLSKLPHLGVFMLWIDLKKDLENWNQHSADQQMIIANAVFSLSSVAYSIDFIRLALDICPDLEPELGHLLKRMDLDDLSNLNLHSSNVNSLNNLNGFNHSSNINDLTSFNNLNKQNQNQNKNDETIQKNQTIQNSINKNHNLKIQRLKYEAFVEEVNYCRFNIINELKRMNIDLINNVHSFDMNKENTNKEKNSSVNNDNNANNVNNANNQINHINNKNYKNIIHHVNELSTSNENVNVNNESSKIKNIENNEELIIQDDTKIEINEIFNKVNFKNKHGNPNVYLNTNLKLNLDLNKNINFNTNTNTNINTNTKENGIEKSWQILLSEYIDEFEIILQDLRQKPTQVLISKIQPLNDSLQKLSKKMPLDASVLREKFNEQLTVLCHQWKYLQQDKNNAFNWLYDAILEQLYARWLLEEYLQNDFLTQNQMNIENNVSNSNESHVNKKYKMISQERKIIFDLILDIERAQKISKQFANHYREKYQQMLNLKTALQNDQMKQDDAKSLAERRMIELQVIQKQEELKNIQKELHAQQDIWLASASPNGKSFDLTENYLKNLKELQNAKEIKEKNLENEDNEKNKKQNQNENKFQHKIIELEQEIKHQYELLNLSEKEKQNTEQEKLNAQSLALTRLQRIRSLEKKLKESQNNGLTPIPNNLKNFENWYQDYLAGGSVELAKKAFNNIKKIASTYQHSNLVYESLLLLRDFYVPMRLQGGDDLRKAYEAELKRLALKDESTGKDVNLYPATYSVQYGGRNHAFERHLKGRDARDKRFCFRLYFSWLEEDQIVLVGWLPTHLDNQST